MRAAQWDELSAKAQQRSEEANRRAFVTAAWASLPDQPTAALCIHSQWTKPFNEVLPIFISKVQVVSKKQPEDGDTELLLGFPEAAFERGTSD